MTNLCTTVFRVNHFFTYLFLLLSIGITTTGFAQKGSTILIGQNDRLVVNSTDSFKYLVGRQAEVRHGATFFKADSIYINERFPRKMQAFGNVYINEADSVITTAQYVEYYIDQKVSMLKNSVTIKTKSGTFTGNEVSYDLNSKLATYTTRSTIVGKNSTLTSGAGKYFANSKNAYFTDNVILKGTDYDVNSDTLEYNITTEVATFNTYTKVFNKKKGQTVETFGGYYDMKKGIANFTSRSTIKDKNSTIIADEMFLDDKEKKANLKGKALITRKDSLGKTEIFRGEIINIDDISQKYHIEGNGLYSSEKDNIVITGNYIDGDGKEGKFLARGKPVAIIKQENDSIFIAADTLYSGRIVKNKKIRTDSIVVNKVVKLDTIYQSDTSRYFEGFHNVRIFSDSTQAVCDSMFFSEADSVFRLYQNPIVWSDKNQITGDTMYMFTKNKKVHRVEVFERAFVLNTVMPNKYYNQIKGNRLNAFFVDGEIDSLHVKGSSEIIFFLQDEDKAYIGVDKSSADVIIANFTNKEIYKLKWINKYDAITTPMKDVNGDGLKLRGFNPLELKRPKSKFELFF